MTWQGAAPQSTALVKGTLLTTPEGELAVGTVALGTALAVGRADTVGAADIADADAVATLDPQPAVASPNPTKSIARTIRVPVS
jgi:hypothetical protein